MILYNSTIQLYRKYTNMHELHKNKKCIAVQFHPEASPGPYDCKFVFDELKNIMEEGTTGKP